MQVLGIDVGGSGIKGAIVETSTGEMVSERYRLDTPQPSTPEALAKTVKKLNDHFAWEEAVLAAHFQLWWLTERPCIAAT